MVRTTTTLHVATVNCCCNATNYAKQAVKNPGFTIVPMRLFINEKGLAKLVIALARGKHEYDKRESIKERDDKREMDRIRKDY